MFALASAGLAGVGHHVSSGEPVTWRLLLAAAGAAFLGALPWAGRQRQLTVVVTGTCAAQLVLHQLLATAWSGRHGTPHTAAHPMAGDHGLHPGAAVMLLAHTLAALGVAVLLHRTDDQLSALPRLVGLLATTVRERVARRLGRWSTYAFRCPDAAPAAAGSRALAGVPVCVVLAHIVVRRGPPGHGPSPFCP
ncbi:MULTISPECIES: hypothetical protein [unclassified Streptomyces]|uniref:hypothetical protein n=1 Tax=unclassified Streptomyces TaxID=2593676 RepID=UPI002DD89064|nr:hypothetical protein [Streptomyces sp. NBC_01750]WSA99388.1 hypothetical protein OIE54_09035 [Streptomyces sp. NBC_01794]WSD36046.1 hypothetical protein OG966_31545 [Streptomyces sp. NBC_01750]